MGHELLYSGVVDFRKQLQVVVVMSQTVVDVRSDGGAHELRVKILRHQRFVETAQKALESRTHLMHRAVCIKRKMHC